MKTRCLWSILAALLAVEGIAVSGAPDAPGQAGVSFIKEVAPVLVRKCLSCHNADKSKGGYNLSAFARAMLPGDSDHSPITAGDPQKSELFQRITASDEEDRMPREDDPLPAADVALIQRWIVEGARFDGGNPEALLISLVPRAPHPNPPKAYRFPVPVTALAFSPDGLELAVGGYHEITIWDPGNGRLLRRISNVAERVYDLAYSSDGTLLAAAGGAPGVAGEVALYRPNEGKLETVLGNMSDVALSLGLSRDGTLLAAGGADSLIHVYDLSSRTERSVIQQHADWVTAIVFDSTGSKIASASRDRSARVYRVSDGELQAGYQGHQSGVFGVGFNQDGALVLSAGLDRRVHIWKSEDAKKTRELSGLGAEISRLLVSGDRAFLGMRDAQVHEYSVGSGKRVRTFQGHQDWICGIACDTPSQRLATGSYDGEVRIWKTESGDLTASFSASPGYVYSGRKTRSASASEFRSD